ncbi:hypothetical protein L6164_008139 [Bauhinia variegata]|uniref:Uncharacterized protein n=1 Tax=Bauhinia variegata TaxID=167791 RepID=A0ACB9PEZ0_BAUVA|nr:hypothetical protein L6164_008139 [Bauhinia variegata]
MSLILRRSSSTSRFFRKTSFILVWMAAQVALRWVSQQEWSALVKSFNKQRMRENLEIFDFELSDEELERMKQIPQRRQFTGDMWLSRSSYRTLNNFGMETLEIFSRK